MIVVSHLMQLFSFLSHIPDVVLSGLLASLLTLAGVMLSNRSNTNRLVKQLTHDSDEKARDRINALRREVYLNAAEEMAKVNGYFGKIPQLDPTKVNIGDGLAEFFAASAKLQLVAQPDTSRLAGELTVRYGEILMDLLLKAMPIHSLNAEIRILSEMCDRNQTEVSRVLAVMTQLNESGQPNPQRFAALQRTFDGSQQLRNDFAAKRDHAFQQLNTAMREYTIAFMGAMRTTGPLQIKLSAAIRGELDLATDVAEYETRLQINWERMDKSMKPMLEMLASGRDS